MTEVLQEHIKRHLLEKTDVTTSTDTTLSEWRLTIEDINGPSGSIWAEREDNGSEKHQFTETDELSIIVDDVIETINSSFVNINRIREHISYITLATATESILVNIRFPLVEAKNHMETLFFQSTRDNEETAQLHSFEYFINLELLDLELDTENPELYDRLHNPNNTRSPPYRIAAHNTPRTIQQTVNALVDVLLGRINLYNQHVELSDTIVQIHPLSNEYDTFLETRANIPLDGFENETAFNLR